VIRPPLILAGAPAVGKTVTARALARDRARCAVIDVDDLRQLVVAGAAAPWEGLEGAKQRSLGASNACALTRSFTAAGFEVVIADVVTPETSDLYKRELPSAVVVHMAVSWPEALRRAATRTRWLTDQEFRSLHLADVARPPDADYRQHVDALTIEQQIVQVGRLWQDATDRRI
jgi:hypothetical protein